jgi:hypothetical protein
MERKLAELTTMTRNRLLAGRRGEPPTDNDRDDDDGCQSYENLGLEPPAGSGTIFGRWE